eukprot:178318-Rhodomonas_salina.2
MMRADHKVEDVPPTLPEAVARGDDAERELGDEDELHDEGDGEVGKRPVVVAVVRPLEDHDQQVDQVCADHERECAVSALNHERVCGTREVARTKRFSADQGSECGPQSQYGPRESVQTTSKC